jgi:CTP synthase
MAIEYARKNNIPFFGICLGMQLAIIEFARNVVKIKNATSEEFSPDGEHIIHYMKGQTKDMKKGGSMRLGAYACSLRPNSLGHKVYGSLEISERHRHRLEVNNHYIKALEEKGLVVSGKNGELDLVELCELPNHPHFMACQFHPEFKSRPHRPHPLFKTFIEASVAHRAH